MIEPFTPARGADDLVKHGTLIDGAHLRVTANVEGTAAIAGAPHCQDLALPAACVLAPGTYAVELAVTGGPRIARTVKLAKKDVEVKVEVGFVDAGPGRVVVLPGGNVRRAAFEPGPRRLTISDGGTSRTVLVTVRAGATVNAP